MRRILFLMVIAIVICSCHQKESNTKELVSDDVAFDEQNVPMTRQELNNPPTSPLPALENGVVLKQKIIKDGRIGIEVAEIDKAKSRIDTIIKRFNGYYSNESLSNSDWETSYQLVIRVPGDRFEKLVSAIESGDGEILFKSIEARDVTDQFIDLETRLANKKSYLDRYNDLLKQAKTVKDILEIEENIRGIEEEIESTTGRLKYLNDLVDYSTLDLKISKPKETKYLINKRDKFSTRILHGLSIGWFGFVDFIIFLVKLWPMVIISILGVILWRKLKRSKPNK